MARSAAPLLSASEQVATPSMVTASRSRGRPNFRTVSMPSDSRPSAVSESIESQSGRSARPAGPAWSHVQGPMRARMRVSSSASSTAGRWLQPGSSNRVVPKRIISAAACLARTCMSCSVRAANDG